MKHPDSQCSRQVAEAGRTQRAQWVFGVMAVVLMASTVLAGSLGPLDRAPETMWPEEVVLSRVVISFAGELPDETPTYIDELGGQVVMVEPSIHFLVVAIDSDDSRELIHKASADENVIAAEYDRHTHAALTPNDMFFPQQWGSGAVNLPAAWEVTTGSPSVDIHILDTGIDATHADLLPNICSLGADFVTFGIGPGMESGFHGSHVAGIAGAAINNTLGVAGASQSCLTPVRVLAAQSGLMAWLASGIVWSTNNGAEIISMSLGASSGTTFVQSAVAYAESNGVLLVAAAGNDNCGAVSYPAAYSEVMAVAALRSSTGRATYSNCGSALDVSAPGSNIWSTLPGNTYGSLSGTSMATPLVSGVAGLVLAENPALTNRDVRCILTSTSTDLGTTGHDMFFGWGRIDAFDAVIAASNPSSVGC